ncbi:organic hydroperoxide resistance protein [Dactylosporangium sp. CA-092794]|uniref:organic hydroperoxide resistance protein n=1 Tax=Dactylosporangium sp. CA-092794 TaxID=3239929 RepID=UPI003D907F13
MQVLYTADVTSTGDGRNGHVASSDGILDFNVALPKEMGGAGGATNPEQLFAAGYSACYHSALRGVARRDQVSVEGSQVNARVGIGPNGSGGYGLEVWLTVTLPGLEPGKAQELADAAHQVCPYSNATRGNIEVHIEVAQ